MSRAVPWSVRGVGFDAREAARDAARRAGMPLGEWLNQVIAESASESGVEPDDLDNHQKLEAISAQLSRLSGREPASPGQQRAQRRVREERLRALEAQSVPPRTSAMDDWADELRDDAPRTGRLREDIRRRARFLDEADDMPQRPAAPHRPLMREERSHFLSHADAESLLEDAVGAFERHAARAQGRTDAALGDVARRLADIEQRLSRRPEDEARPLRATFDRLERRIEAFARNLNEQSGDDGRVEATLSDLARSLDRLSQRLDERPALPDNDELLKRLDSRLDKKLGSIIEAIRQQPAPAAPDESGPRRIIGRHPLRAGLDQAVADISLRQRLLDGAAATARATAAPAAQALAAPADFDSRLESIASRMERAADLAGRPERNGLAGLHAEISRLASRIEAMAAEPLRGSDADARFHEETQRQIDAKIDAMREAMQGELASLSRAIAGLAPKDSLARLEGSIQSLAERIEDTRAQGVAEDAIAPVEKLAAEIREAVQGMDPRGLISELDREVRTLGRRLDAIASDGFDPQAFNDMRVQTREMRDLLAAASARPLPIDKIEKEVALLSQRLDRLSSVSATATHPGMADALGEIRAMVEGSLNNPGIEALERRVEALAGKLDAAIARPAETDSTSIEAMIAELAQRIENARGSGEADSHAMAQMRADIARITETIARADLSIPALDGIEHAIAGLATQIEDMRRSTVAAAEEAASRMVRQALDEAPALTQQEDSLVLSRALADLRSLQSETDHRTHASLSAVHDMLEKIVDRLTMLEDEVADVATETPQTAPRLPEARALDGMDWEQALKGAPRETRPTAQGRPPAPPSPAESRPVLPDDLLIEPGSGFAPGKARAVAQDEAKADRRAERAPAVSTASEDRKGGKGSASSTFIAAARRLQAQGAADTAIQTAAAKAAAAQKAKAEEKGLSGDADAPPAKSFMETRKKPILIGLLGLSVILGSAAVVRNFLAEPQPAPHSAAGESAAPSAAAPVASLPEAPASAETPAAPTLAPQAAAPAPVDGAAVASIDPSTLTGPAGLRSAALSGNAAAQYEIGARFAEGRGVARDYKAASAWFERAAGQGVAPAQYRLATLLEKGLGVSRDLPLAKAWYEKAAEKGNARAMHNLAVLTADGAGGKPDYVVAADWFRKAAELGIRDSQYNLAILYARGLGIEQNLVQSYRWFAIAAAQGDEDAGKKRDEVGQRLTPDQLKEGKARAETFRAKPQDSAANEVAVPAAGWDAAPRSDAPEKVQSRAPAGRPAARMTAL